MKYEVLKDSGFNKKGDIVDLEIINDEGSVTFRMANVEGAMYNPINYSSKEMFDSKYRILLA